MSLKGILRIRRTLAFRLTLWYAMIFTLSSLAVFLIIYISISSAIQRGLDNELLEDIAEFMSILRLKSGDSLKTEIDIESESDGVDRIFFRVLEPGGKEIASSNMSSWGGTGISRSALKRINDAGGYVFETRSLRGRKYNARILYGAIGPGKIMQIGKSMEEDGRFRSVLREAFGSIMIIVMLLSALIGWFMARRALSGVEEVTQAALDISKGAFERRVQVKSKSDEIMRLATAFNFMLDRIDMLMAGMREMTDNIAHDLKTPLTRIRGLAELELNRLGGNEKSQELAAGTIEECDYLIQMINTMLAISETEAGIAGNEKEEVDIADVVQGACDLFRPITEEKAISLLFEGSGPLPFTGDLQGLQRMIVNLLENAVKYTPAGGTVTVSVHQEKGNIVVAFRDTGTGISEVDLPHIFERLYRCEPSRSQPGFGLGLSLAQAVARAHGGDIHVTSLLGEGSLFKVSLPRVPARS